MGYNNLAEKAAQAKKRRSRPPFDFKKLLAAIGKVFAAIGMGIGYGFMYAGLGIWTAVKYTGIFIAENIKVIGIVLGGIVLAACAIGAPFLMFMNNARIDPRLFLWGQIAVIAEFAMVAVGIGVAIFFNEKESQENSSRTPTIYLFRREYVSYATEKTLALMFSAVFLVLAIIGCANATFSKDDWQKTESGLYYVMEDGGIHIKGIDSDVSSVTIEEEYDYFQVRDIDISIGKRDALEHLVVKLGDFVTTDFDFRGAESLKSVTFEGGNLTLRRKSFHKCPSLESVSILDCNAFIREKAFKKSYLLLLSVKDSTLTFEERAFTKTGVADLYAEGGTLKGYDVYEANVPCDPFYECTLNRATLKNTDLSDIHTDIGTLILDGVCHIKLNRTFYNANNERRGEDIIIRSLVLAEGFDSTQSTLSHVDDKYKKSELISADYLPISGHIYIPETLTTLPDRLFGDKLTAATPKVTVHYGGSEEAWGAVTAGAENNALFAEAAVRYNETHEVWGK